MSWRKRSLSLRPTDWYGGERVWSLPDGSEVAHVIPSRLAEGSPTPWWAMNLDFEAEYFATESEARAFAISRSPSRSPSFDVRGLCSALASGVPVLVLALIAPCLFVVVVASALIQAITVAERKLPNVVDLDARALGFALGLVLSTVAVLFLG